MAHCGLLTKRVWKKLHTTLLYSTVLISNSCLTCCGEEFMLLGIKVASLFVYGDVKVRA
jgi:hypothetical protein